MHSPSCCSPQVPVVVAPSMPPPPARPASAPDAAIATGAGPDDHDAEQVAVPPGRFVMGDAQRDGRLLDGEHHLHEVEVDGFVIDATPVTNDAFGRFVAATGYVTEAESFGWSAVFHLAMTPDDEAVMGSFPGTPWWFGVRGADSQHPRGPGSSVEEIGDHPVVHVTWNDAVAYCAWAGRRLPTEAEWEYASRGGLDGARYPWGDELHGDDGWRCNIWQGTFPEVNTEEDGYLTTAPVRSFQPNGYGLWQTVGNVWEWCSDWFSPRYYEQSPVVAPRGPATGEARVMRGGSFLCHDSYCNRYRNSARSSNTADSSMANAGFRTVAGGGPDA
jgi:sulfatase modifying factor 1